MASRTPTEQMLFEYVEGFAHQPSDAQIEECTARCDRHGHPFIGPVLQYKVDNYNLGRYLMICKSKHPGDPVHPGPHHKPVSDPLALTVRRQIGKYRRDNGIKADGSPVQKRSKKKKSQSAVTQATSDVIDLTLPTGQPASAQVQAPAPPPPAAPARSPSVEITRVVPAPILSHKLEVWYFHQNKMQPTSLTLKARPARREYRFRQYAVSLLNVEIKQTDLINVLTTATNGVQTWSSFRVSELAIPRTQSTIIISRRCVETFHECFPALYEHAYPGAAQLPNRIMPLP